MSLSRLQPLARSHMVPAGSAVIAWDYDATDTARQVKGVVCHALGLPADVVKKLFYISA